MKYMYHEKDIYALQHGTANAVAAYWIATAYQARVLGFARPPQLTPY